MADDALFDVDPDWKDIWRGMPDYSHEDLQSWQSVLVHFKTQDDRRAFAELVKQELHVKTKFIWFPRAEIRRAADKVYTGAKVTPRYPVYIISKGRWDSRLTVKCLEWIKVPYSVVVEPQEYDQYAAVIDPSKILVLPFSNLGLGGIPARNWVWEHAVASGAARHWILDDNIGGFCRFQDNLKVELDNGASFCAIEDFVDRYENVAMAAFNYDYFAPRKQGARIRPITLNTRCYSGILLSNTIAHRWRGRYNEDTDLSLRILKEGLCTVLFNAFLMYKKPTLTMKGGNTDELYAGVEAMAAEWAAHVAACEAGCKEDENPRCDEGRAILSKDGRWLMAESLREQHPDCVTIERKWGRWQHQVDYRAFSPALGRNVLRLRPDAVIPDGADEYGLSLGAMPGEIGHDARNAGKAAKADLPSSPVSALAFVLSQAESAIPAGQVEVRVEAPAAVATSARDVPSQGNGIQGEKPATSQDTAELAQTAGPSSQPAGYSRLSADQGTLATELLQPVPSQLEEAAALQASLTARGHRLLLRDGKFFVSEAGRLTDEDREGIKLCRDALIALAEPWPLETRATQTLAQFLSSESPRSAETWTLDEPPSLAGIDEVVLNFATNGLDWANGARPVGVTVGTLDGVLSRFLPFAFAGGNLDEGAVKEWARRELRGKRILNANTKFDVHVAREWGVDLEGQGCTFSDIQHTAALLDDHRKRFALDLLAEDYLPRLPMVPRVDEARHHEHHASEVAKRELFTVELVRRLRDVMYPQIVKEELGEIQALEDDVIPAVVEMEKNGAPIDTELLDQYHRECHGAHDALMLEVSKEVGFAFEHTASGWKKLLEYLGFDQIDGYAEDKLSKLDHPLIRKGQLASQHASLCSKVFDPYKKNVGSDGVLRYSINQLRGDEGGTVSGRFSIEYVQQVPNHDNHSAAFGDRWFPRRLYVPRDKSHQYFEADAAQIEFRLFSHYANNRAILDAYAKDPWMSFHRTTWEMIKAYKPNMLYTHMKNFNFAGQYGARSIKLAVMMEFITAEEGDEIRRAKRWNDPRLNLIHEIEAAYKRMLPERDELLDYAAHLAKPECDEYCKRGDKLHRQYAHRGYVKTLRGRRSRFPTNYKAYIGLNRVLQGTGADYMKLKLAALHRERKDTGLILRLTNHDAALGDATRPDTLAKVSEVLNAQGYPELRVPILWECKVGPNWGDCK